MNTTWHSIGGGAYEERLDGKATGRFAERPRGKTWRLLRGVNTRREAIKASVNRDPRTVGSKFAALAERYLAAGCPDSNNEPRHAEYCANEKRNLTHLIGYFGAWPMDRPSHADWPEYKRFRTAPMPDGRSGFRAVDKDHQTISNVYQFAVVNRFYPHNPFAGRYKHYQRPELIKTARTRAPQSADQIHAVARELLGKVETESVGWVTLFAMFTGCRVSELLRLRMSAAHRAPDQFDPGYVFTRAGDDDGTLPRHFLMLGRRSKRGINPQIVIGTEFMDMIRAHQNWHRQRHPKSEWYFPRMHGKLPVDRWVTARQIARIAGELGYHRITPHGFRSFYNTKRRSEGISDEQIAFEMGDKTVNLVQNKYAAAPDSWIGGHKLGWLPLNGTPAWSNWTPQTAAVGQKVDFLLTDGRNRITTEPVELKTIAGVAKWQTHRT